MPDIPEAEVIKQQRPTFLLAFAGNMMFNFCQD